MDSAESRPLRHSGRSCSIFGICRIGVFLPFLPFDHLLDPVAGVPIVIDPDPADRACRRVPKATPIPGWQCSSSSIAGPMPNGNDDSVLRTRKSWPLESAQNPSNWCRRLILRASGTAQSALRWFPGHGRGESGEIQNQPVRQETFPAPIQSDSVARPISTSV